MTESHVVPPHSIDAEQAVLGGLMLSADAWDRVCDRLSEVDFYRRDHQLIFRAIGDLAQAGKPCDAVTMGEWFEAQGLSEKVGGTRYVLELANITPSAANILAYAEIVREKAMLRKVIDAGIEITRAGFTPDGKHSRQIIEDAERVVFEIAAAGSKGKRGPVSVKQSARSSFQALQARFDNGGAIPGLATGFPDIDGRTLGLGAGDLIVLAARPSMGKTALAVNIATNVALKGIGAAIFSLEMSAQQITDRMICAVGKVNFTGFRRGDLDDHEWPRVTEAITRINTAPLWIDDTPGMTPVEIRARCRRLKREHDIGLVVIDYLQLMSMPGKRENRTTEVADMSRSMKLLARELNVPVVALSQLNRAVEQRSDKRPGMSDLRESGAIEQDADMVLFVHREHYYNPTKENEAHAELIIGKQRNGPTGVVNMAFLGQYTRFDSWEGPPPERGVKPRVSGGFGRGHHKGASDDD